jgi:hypothetical protein
MNTVSINDVVARYDQIPDGQRQDLVNALVEREEGIAEALRLAGLQFGVYPQIVAEVFAQVEIGQPLEETQREFIRAQFVALMEQLQRQHGQG